MSCAFVFVVCATRSFLCDALVGVGALLHGETDVVRDDFVVAGALLLDFLDAPDPLDCMSRNEASNVSSEWRLSVRLRRHACVTILRYRRALPLESLDAHASLDCMSRNEASNVTS